MSFIISPQEYAEKYEAAAKALDVKLALEGSSFKSQLLTALFTQLNNPEFTQSDNETLQMFELIQNIKHNTPKGEKAVAEFKSMMVAKFMIDQEAYESTN